MSEQTEHHLPVRAPLSADSYVDWGAILAGSVIATAIGFVFTTFGAAIGLASISPYDGDGFAMAAIIAISLWMLWTTVSSFMAGAYVAGRLRRRIDPVGADEVGIRDGIHGLAVWGVGVILGAVLLSATADTAALTAAQSGIEMAQGGETGQAAISDLTDEEIQAAAETARQYSVLSTFALSAALMIAAAGAYWAAGAGGRHRDENIQFARFGTWR